jgi:hypothetical protein
MLAALKSGQDPLEVSIKKWQDIVDGKAACQGAEDCALCKTYQKDDGCDCCPVKAKTGLDYCWGTPVTSFSTYYTEAEKNKAELNFLISLRKSAQPEQVKPQ